MDNQLQNPQPHQNPEFDLRLKATKTIWGCSVGMFGISVPLSAATHSGQIPCLVLIAATVSTTVIWLSKGLRSTFQPPVSAPTTVTPEQLKALEERLANVEVISSFERGLNERERAMTEAPRVSERARVERAPMVREG